MKARTVGETGSLCVFGAGSSSFSSYPRCTRFEAVCCCNQVVSLSQGGICKSTAGLARDVRCPDMASKAPCHPFTLGVASGDPTHEGFIIWARAPSQNATAVVRVDWAVASDNEFKQVKQQGLVVTSLDVDWSVKVDVANLKPKKVYYYQVIVDGTASMIGRSKTLPGANDKAPERVNLAVASCAWLSYGCFNAYDAIADWAENNRLDAVLSPDDRHRIYRQFQFGKLASLLMLDTRFTGRDPEQPSQPFNTSDMRYFNVGINAPYNAQAPARDEGSSHLPSPPCMDDCTCIAPAPWSVMHAAAPPPLPPLLHLQDLPPSHPPLLGTRVILSLRKWVRDNLLKAKADKVTWKVLGQQIVFAPAWRFTNGAINTDGWDGYAAERERILDTIVQHAIDNVVVLTGDVHSSFAMDVPREQFKAYEPETGAGYDPTTGRGSLAVVMVCNAVGFDNLFRTQNRNVKYVQSLYKGILHLELNKVEAAGTWLDVNTIRTRNSALTYSDTYFTALGTNRVQARPNPFGPRTPGPVCGGSGK
ncbi:alkaline phosphatase, putative [Haematococcus lacustris]|uniref:Alkaline phosphatase, putative n=1 Tax=Haematococcus lacustris TaxID=44745 RepID=A0A699Z4T1_HAELA|nr:alkaline phosphatase, putative [Haematococcus lacustris]